MKRVQLNAKTKRGLLLARDLLISVWDGENALPANQVAKWPKYKQSEMNQALDWLDQLDQGDPSLCPASTQSSSTDSSDDTSVTAKPETPPSSSSA